MHAGKLKVFRPQRGWNGGGKVKVSAGENNRLTWKERPDATTNKFGHQFPLQRIHEKTCKIQIFPSNANKNVIPF